MKTTTSITIDTELKQLWEANGRIGLSEFVSRRLKDALATGEIHDGTMMAECNGCGARISTQSPAFFGECLSCKCTIFKLSRG